MQFRFAQPLTPALSHGERETYGDVLQTRFAQTLIPAFSQWEKEEEREAIRRLNPAIPGEARATIKRYLQVRFEREMNP